MAEMTKPTTSFVALAWRGGLQEGGASNGEREMKVLLLECGGGGSG